MAVSYGAPSVASDFLPVSAFECASRDNQGYVDIDAANMHRFDFLNLLACSLES
jgi:hypothetical protein